MKLVFDSLMKMVLDFLLEMVFDSLLEMAFYSRRNFMNFCCTNLGEYLSSFSRSSPFMKRRSNSFCPCLKEESCCDKGSPWMMIPRDIFEKILVKLSPLEVVRMGEVCLHWKSIIESGDVRKPQKDMDVPWLLLPQQQQDDDQISFYGISSGRIYNFELPKLLRGGRCCGVSNGWLFILTAVSRYIYIPFVPHYVPHLWDPISGETISLPSLETIPNCYLSLAKRFPYGLQRIIRRIEVISVGSGQLVVAAIFRTTTAVGLQYRHVLGFCRPQDRKWTILEGLKISFLSDIVFHNGVLYVLKQEPPMQEERHFLISLGDYKLRLVFILFSFRFQHHLPAGFPTTVHHPNFRIIRGSRKMPYLAESTMGELLLVWRILDRLEKHPTPTGPLISRNIYWQTTSFLVDVINFEPGSYSPIFTRMRSLKDEALLVASSGSLSHGGSEFDKNCINFLGDQVHLCCSPIISRDSGIFHLSDSKVKRSLPSMPVPIQSTIGWFKPNFP